jgi:hypothetical protein
MARKADHAMLGMPAGGGNSLTQQGYVEVRREAGSDSNLLLGRFTYNCALLLVLPALIVRRYLC